MYWCEHAFIDGAAGGEGAGDTGSVRHGVAVETTADGRIAAVRTGVDAPPPGAVPLRGLTVPGLADAHSHAFHRALRGVAQVGSGTFWTWRETMYAVAERLTPDAYFTLARAVYAELALAGITCVGEFHYVHHPAKGGRYDEPNAMGHALVAAAGEAGVRITLLDTAYLAGGFAPSGGHEPPSARQARFSDGSVEAWAERATALAEGAGSGLGSAGGSPYARVGAAVHSVRAVPARELATVAGWAEARSAPLHVHLSEQPGENEACLQAYGTTPARLLADHGVLGPRTTAVHATHLTDADVRLLGGSGTGVCMCPTTERDLADGIGPAPQLAAAGSPLSLGSDSHAVVDPWEEARALELNERLRSRTRGHWTAAELLRTASEQGHTALGWPDAGRLAAGRLADFTTLALDSVRTAGPPPELGVETAVFAATAADVRHTVVAGRHVVRNGAHRTISDVPGELAAAVRELSRAEPK